MSKLDKLFICSWMILAVSALVLAISLPKAETEYIESPPVTVTQTIEKIVPEVREVIKEVPVIKEVRTVITKEVIKKEIQRLRYFESQQELKEWLDRTPFTIPSYQGFDCEDYARIMQEDAARDGYFISMQAQALTNHMLNSTVIGNLFILIEPQTHKYWVEFPLD